jgi:sugar/nucleoside kinase (ribokinase family)
MFTPEKPGTYLAFTDADEVDTVVFNEDEIASITEEKDEDNEDNEDILVVTDHKGIRYIVMGGVYVFIIEPKS